MVNTNFWIKNDGLGIDVFLLCSLILSLFNKKNRKKENSQSQFVALPKPTEKAPEVFLPAV